MVSGAALETIFIEDMKPIYSTPILELRKKIEHGMVLRVVHCHALVLEQLNSTQHNTTHMLFGYNVAPHCIDTVKEGSIVLLIPNAIVAVGALKAYLLELPDSLLSHSLYADYMEAIGMYRCKHLIA
jgi:hypothetical protein